jgi:beta-lactam-binding protein with PASTA domain
VSDGQVLNTNPEPGESAAPDTQIVLLIAQPGAGD